MSNVEQYLFQDGKFDAFARNVATLPVDARSTFIRSVSTRFGYGGTIAHAVLEQAPTPPPAPAPRRLAHTLVLSAASGPAPGTRSSLIEPEYV